MRNANGIVSFAQGVWPGTLSSRVRTLSEGGLSAASGDLLTFVFSPVVAGLEAGLEASHYTIISWFCV
jgi:hypothetical protein